MSAEQTQPLVDLQRLVVALRRKRRFWLTTALAGLVLGCAVAILLPAPPTAVTKIMVIHPDDSPTDSGTLMRTDVAVLSTANMAAAALKRINSTESPSDFLKDYAGLGLTNNVMQVTVKAKTKDDAVAKAKALADAFIAEHTQRTQAAATGRSKALLLQRDQAQAQLADIDNQAATEVAKGRNSNAGALEQLYTQRANLVSKIADLQNQAQQAGIGSPEVIAGTQIVDTPAIQPVSKLKTYGTDGGVGLALGLALGLAFAAVTALVRDRPVLRREISQHLGASVIAQVGVKPIGPAKLWRRSQAVTESGRVALTLARAAREDRASLSLLEIGAASTAAELAVELGRSLAEDGPVVLVDDLPGKEVSRLPVEGNVQVVEAGDPAVARAVRRVGVGTAAPGTAWTDLSALGAETVLVVRAGFANTQWLHTVARQLADCGVPILGVVLVDPDPKDHTDGTLWDGLHTALRGRAAVVAKKQEDPVAELELGGETKPIEWPGKRDTERRRRPLDRARPPLPHERMDVDPDAPTRRLKPVQEN